MSVFVDPGLAAIRIYYFNDKNDALENVLKFRQRPRIMHKPPVFVSLLKAIKASGDGLRIYFACADATPNELDLIFSITDKTGNDKNIFYNIVSGALSAPMNFADANNWVKNAAKFLNVTKSTNPNGIETISIFYSIDKIDEIIKFIKDENVISVMSCFASYCDVDDPSANPDDKNYSNQLSLIFQLKGKKLSIVDDKKVNHVFFSFGISHSPELDGSADTGVPCPPPPPPSTKCPGSLPQ